MVLTAPPTVVEVTRSVEERQDDGDDASARLAGEFLPRGDGNPAQLAVRRRRVFCEGRTGNNEARPLRQAQGPFFRYRIPTRLVGARAGRTPLCPLYILLWIFRKNAGHARGTG